MCAHLHSSAAFHRIGLDYQSRQETHAAARSQYICCSRRAALHAVQPPEVEAYALTKFTQLDLVSMCWRGAMGQSRGFTERDAQRGHAKGRFNIDHIMWCYCYIVCHEAGFGRSLCPPIHMGLTPWRELSKVVL